MVKPLRTDDPAPQNMQFAHFGVLNDGNQSKASLFTSITLNILLALCAIIIGAAAKKTMDNHIKLTHLDEPIPIKKPEPPPIVVKPPKLPPPPVVAKIEPPKIKMPDVKMPDIPKPQGNVGHAGIKQRHGSGFKGCQSWFRFSRQPEHERQR